MQKVCSICVLSDTRSYSHGMYHVLGSVFYATSEISSSFPIDYRFISYAVPVRFTLAYIPA